MRSADLVIISPRLSIREALRVIDAGQLGLALVCGADRRLEGIVNDVDVRKGLLRGIGLEDPVERILCTHPLIGNEKMSRSEIMQLMHRTGVRQLPIVDSENRVLGVEILKDLTTIPLHEIPVIVMAGGLGQRLRPLTDSVPKPMLPLGGKPILERLVEHLRQQGFSQLFFSVNYRAEVIERHFGDGARWGMQVKYLREKEWQGTAGSIGLLDPAPYSTIVLVNGDLVTDLNFERLLEYHYGHESDVTIGSKKYQFDVPFGVLELEGDVVTEIKEKPRTSFQVSAGIYVFKARALEGLDWSGALDMPELLRRLMRRGSRVQAYPIREKWIDIGSPEDYQRALAEYKSGEDNV